MKPRGRQISGLKFQKRLKCAQTAAFDTAHLATKIFSARAAHVATKIFSAHTAHVATKIFSAHTAHVATKIFLPTQSKY